MKTPQHLAACKAQIYHYLVRFTSGLEGYSINPRLISVVQCLTKINGRYHATKKKV